MPAWVFKSIAVLWGIGLAWFALLTAAQTLYLYLGFVLEMFGLIATPWAKKRSHGKELTEGEYILVTLFFLPFFCAGMALVSGAFYLGLAWLRLNKLL